MTVSFNAMLDPETDTMLIQLAEAGRVSKAAIVREGIRGHFDMVQHRKPTCANGGACLCPHAHLYPAQAPAPPGNPDGYQEGR